MVKLRVEKGYAFEVMVHQKTNSFLVPSGKAGKDFILELAIDYIRLILTTLLYILLHLSTACCVFQVYCYFRSLMPPS